jgi:hypothetical protein
MGGQPHEILSLEEDPPADDPPRRIDQSEDGEAGDRLARSGLPDKPEHLAAVDLETHSVDGFDDALLGEEMGLEILDHESWMAHDALPHRSSRGFSTSRRRSPTMLMLKTRRTSRRPG